MNFTLILPYKSDIQWLKKRNSVIYLNHIYSNYM